ncbi:MAG: aspartyl protease family protein [Planctomycetota bacterium]|jgi:predicted aspartyl protease
MRPALLLTLLLAGCAQSNAAYVAELEQLAIDRPDPGADRLLKGRPGPVTQAGGPTRITLPLRPDRVPTVIGRINGVEMPLMLDSGASLVSLSGPAARAARVYLPPGREQRAISPGFDARYRMGVFDSIEVGPASFGRGVAAIPLKDRFGGRYAIVGCTVLGGFDVTFDFAGRQVTLVRRPGAASGPFFADVKIQGTTYRLLVDSGATRIFLEPWAARELGLISKREEKEHEGKSQTFRAGRVTRVRLEKIEVAGRVFEHVAAGVVHTFGDQTKNRAAGLLGLAGLGKLVWTLDFSAQKIRLER